ncbi:MAG TPA: hypothetical protein VGQ39_15120 [Pyrinomonadaceae bacterium]|jgi:hypothetical protein|nr:hypothetical protein [Pyrinomonadaceae bacterium]
MEFLLEIFLEFLIQIVGELLFDVVLHTTSRFIRARQTLNALLTGIMYLGFGLFVGWLSILIFPRAFVRSSNLHGINLLITPVLAGFTMSVIGWIRVRQGKLLIRLETFHAVSFLLLRWL